MRRSHRIADRTQLRGRRREQHSQWRRRLRGVSLRDHRRGPPTGAAPHEYRVDLRVWQPRRVLAADASVRGAPDPDHRLRRGDGALAQSRRRPRDGRRGGTKSPATAGAGSTIKKSTRRSNANISTARSRRSKKAPGNGRSVGTPGGRARAPGFSSPRRAGFSMTPTPMPTICRIGSRSADAII
jgi:hypothetical protein